MYGLWDERPWSAMVRNCLAPSPPTLLFHYGFGIDFGENVQGWGGGTLVLDLPPFLSFSDQIDVRLKRK